MKAALKDAMLVGLKAVLTESTTVGVLAVWKELMKAVEKAG